MKQSLTKLTGDGNLGPGSDQEVKWPYPDQAEVEDQADLGRHRTARLICQIRRNPKIRPSTTQIRPRPKSGVATNGP